MSIYLIHPQVAFNSKLSLSYEVMGGGVSYLIIRTWRGVSYLIMRSWRGVSYPIIRS